jgi:hypothetical protein
MGLFEYFNTLLGEKYGKIKSICAKGSWLYTPEGKVKICIPRLVTEDEGETLPRNLSDELLEEEVLFIETDKGIISKEGRDYVFFPKGSYKLIWKG